MGKAEELFYKKLKANMAYYAEHVEEIELMYLDCFNEVKQTEMVNSQGRDNFKWLVE